MKNTTTISLTEEDIKKAIKEYAINKYGALVNQALVKLECEVKLEDSGNRMGGPIEKKTFSAALTINNELDSESILDNIKDIFDSSLLKGIPIKEIGMLNLLIGAVQHTPEKIESLIKIARKSNDNPTPMYSNVLNIIEKTIGNTSKAISLAKAIKKAL